MIQIFAGDDRYRLLDKQKKLQREGAEVVEVLTEEIISSGGFAALFGVRKYILWCHSVEDYSADNLLSFIKRESVQLYLFSESASAGKTMRALENAGAQFIRLDKVAEGQLEQYIAEKVARSDSQIKRSAIRLLVSRCAYYDSDSSDLGTVINELDKLMAVCRNAEITEEDVIKYTDIVPVANAFTFTDFVLKGDIVRALECANVLMSHRGFEALRTISLLEQRYRVAYKASLLDGTSAEKKKLLGVRVLHEVDPGVASIGLQLIAEAKADIKSGNSDIAVFLRLVYQLCQLK